MVTIEGLCVSWKKSKAILFLNFLSSFLIFGFGILNFCNLLCLAWGIFVLLFMNDKNHTLKKETACYNYLDVIHEIWITFIFRIRLNNVSICCNCENYFGYQILLYFPKGPYIKYAGGGNGGFLWGAWNILGIYWWAIKYFPKFLMGHKIFSYVLFS